MDVNDLYKFKNQLNNEGIIFCYSGPITQGIIEEIGEVARHKMKLEETSLSVTQKVFSTFVEQVQNVMKYSETDVTKDSEAYHLKSGVIIIGESKKKFYVESGNLVNNGNKDELISRIEKINKMNKDELVDYYKQQLKKDTDLNKNSVGLGLIEMARKSSEPIEYHFKEIEKGKYFFSLKIVI